MESQAFAGDLASIEEDARWSYPWFFGDNGEEITATNRLMAENLLSK